MKGKRIYNKRRNIERRESTTEQNDLSLDSTPKIPLSALRLPSIAIVGRPNVGKSSLFNAILKRRQAIVHFESGVTRDRVTAAATHERRLFLVTDTGGLAIYTGEKKSVSFWDTMIADQADAAIENADVILFLVDAQAGLLPLDREIAQKLRQCGKKVLLVANKADNGEDIYRADEFHELGFDKVWPVSSLHRRGIGSMLDAALADMERINPDDVPKDARLKIAVLGRPNVGKSSLVNRLLGENRVIVSDVAGTTRDNVDTDFTLQLGEEEIPATLVDTAGLRKRSKVDEAVEHYSAMRASDALAECDIVLFVLEANVGQATAQDKSIARMIEDSGKACVMVVNKWDIRVQGATTQDVLREMRYTLPKMAYAPIVFVSAENGWNFSSLYETIAHVRAQLAVRIPTAMLNRVIQEAITKNLPPVVGTKPLKIYYGAMTGDNPPCVTLIVNKTGLCADSYKQYLINCFRKSFALTGLPVRIRLEERSRRDLSEVVNHAGSRRKKVANAKQYKKAKAEERAYKIKKRREQRGKNKADS